MNIRKKLGLSKRRYKLKMIVSGDLCKFFAKRYMVFWIVTIIAGIAFLYNLDNGFYETWIAVSILYFIFALFYSAVILLQNNELSELSDRISYIYDEDYSVNEADEGSFCFEEFENLNKIALKLQEITRENKELKSTVEYLDARIDKICSGDFGICEYDGDSISGVYDEKLNNLSRVISKTIESKTAAERTKVELVTNVSHDLKTPLTSIVSYIDLLSKVNDMPDEAMEYIEIISRKSECLSHTVCDLFDIAKASAMQDIELEQLDGVMLLKQVLADMQDRIEECDTPVRDSYADSACKIISNGKKLYRVFQNLLDNALKYSLSGSRIYVLQYSDDESFTVEISNTANYEMTFDTKEIQERFVRGDKSRTDEESNGLGLSIVSTFTKACGGKFDVNIDMDRFVAKVSFPKIKYISD